MYIQITTLILGYDNEIQYTYKSTKPNTNEAIKDLLIQVNNDLDEDKQKYQSMGSVKEAYEIFNLTTNVYDIDDQGNAKMISNDDLEGHILYSTSEILSIFTKHFLALKRQLYQKLKVQSDDDDDKPLFNQFHMDIHIQYSNGGNELQVIDCHQSL